MTPAEIETFLEESKQEAIASRNNPSLAESIEAGRSVAQRIADRLKDDADFRRAVEQDPTVLVRDGLPKPAIYDFLSEAAYPDNTVVCKGNHDQTCGNTCIITKCVCTSNTIPW